MTTPCDQVTAELSAVVDGDRDAIARHAAHLAGCDACRDARHDASRLTALVGVAGDDHAPPVDLTARVLAALDREAALHARPSDAPASAPRARRRSDHPSPNAIGRDPLAATAIAALPAAAMPGGSGPDLTAASATGAASIATEHGAASTGAGDRAGAGANAVWARPAGGAARDASAPTDRAAHRREQPPAPRSPSQRNAAVFPSQRGARRRWPVLAAGVALAAGAAGLVLLRSKDSPAVQTAAAGPIGKLTKLERAGAAGGQSGVTIREGAVWRSLGAGEPIPAGAELRTDERTRAALALADGTRLVLDHRTAIAFQPDDARRIGLHGGRIAADVPQLGRIAAITTPGGRIEVAARPAPGESSAPSASLATRDATGDLARGVSTRFSVTATDDLTSVQVTRDAVVLAGQRGQRDDVRAGEEGVIERGALSVGAAPGLARDAAWSELAPPAQPDEVASGLGALRAYKPGESRDRDWKLALARHDVKIRVVGPIARTEITETFRNDSAATLEGVYQFPLPPDAQIDGLSLDVNGGFVDGAFVDKERGARIWRGVIDRATPHPVQRPSQEIIWVEGRWRDPALLDWKRGGRFELRVYPIPAHGARTIKLAYTQVVTPRGPWRQYSYPLPHSRDGSTVADEFTVDVEVRGAEQGAVRAAGYDLTADPARRSVNALTLRQPGFVPRGDLVIDYRAESGDAELRAWTFAGGAAAAPDDRLATRKNVGIDPRVVAAQRDVAADLRPTAVLALRPHLPRWRDGAAHDYLIVVDGSQSMVGERYTRASELATAIVAQMDRRDRFGVAVCDSECRFLEGGSPDPMRGPASDLRSPSPQAATDVQRWLGTQTPAGASDLVAALRAAGDRLGRGGDREPWILYLGDGFASTGFRRVGDIERAVATGPSGPRIATIGIGTDADAAVLQAAARGGGGSYLAWLPGQRITTAAAAALESTLGTALRDAVVELPAGLTDVAPAVLPTVRAGEEVLIAARMTGEGTVTGDVVVRGRVAGQPFEQRYPLKLAASAAAGNGFVPRLWATLAIEQLERAGTAGDRARLVALSQGYGVMSRETSLLVLESQAMFDAFGVDRHRPAATWTGEEALDEVASTGAIAIDGGLRSPATKAARASNKDLDSIHDPYADKAAEKSDRLAGAAEAPPATTSPAHRMPANPYGGPPAASRPAPPAPIDARKGEGRSRWSPGDDWIQLRRVWVRVPEVAPYGTVSPAIARAVADAEAALAASPDSREKHRALVQALSYAGELGRARDVARRWLERDQLDPQALGTIADLLGRDGQRELALRTLAGLVDLDADRVALHERMVRAYEQVGRLAQACAHRIAIASLQPAVPAASAGALRCLRALGRDADAQLVLRALPDDASRATVEKAALVAPLPAPVTGDLVVKARWDAPADLDIALIAPDGTRVSWMGGRSDVVTGDVTSRDREELAVKSLRRGNYLIEISRAGPSATDAPVFGIPLPAAPGGPTAPAAPIRGTLDITALGAHRAIPFELSAGRAVVSRVTVRLEERFEDLDGTPVQLYNGPGRRIIPDRR